MENTNRRTKLTKLMIHEAFIELLKTNTLQKITIRELCEKADINRSTFYKHYHDQYELFDEIENELIISIAEILNENIDNPTVLIRVLTEYVNDNLDFLRILTNGNVDVGFPKKLTSLPLLKHKFFDYSPEEMSDSEFEYTYSFFAYGIYSVFCEWINKEDREDPDDMLKLMIKLCS